MSRAPRQAQPKSGDQEPGTEHRDVAPGGEFTLALDDARRTAEALTQAGWPVPPHIQQQLDAAGDPSPAPVVAADEPSES